MRKKLVALILLVALAIGFSMTGFIEVGMDDGRDKSLVWYWRQGTDRPFKSKMHVGRGLFAGIGASLELKAIEDRIIYVF